MATCIFCHGPLDMGRVLADEDRLEVLDRGLDHARPARTFADTGDAVVGVDLDEQPVAYAADLRWLLCRDGCDQVVSEAQLFGSGEPACMRKVRMSVIFMLSFRGS